jgi:D-xylose transport system substrate-binding protein
MIGKKRKIGRVAVTLTAGLMLATFSPISTSNAATSSIKGTVAFLIAENQTPRWEQQDLPFLKAAIKKLAPGLKVTSYNAEGDPGKQLNQAQSALAAGAKVLIVAAVDQVQAAQIVNISHKAKVPVISYDHFVRKAKLDYYVAADGIAIGKLQGQWLAANTKDGDNIAVINGSTDDANAHSFNTGAMQVLQPLFTSGKRHLVGQQWTQGWVPATAQQEMEQILTVNNDKVNGVLSANDGMAAAIIQALKARGLAGKVPVTGLDGTLASDQLILRGLQSMTVWRSLKTQAGIAAQIAVALASGKKPSALLFKGKSMNNGLINVPWAQVPPMVIDKTNMKLLLADGAVTKAALCSGIAAGVGPC